jgi:hypothetical protein
MAAVLRFSRTISIRLQTGLPPWARLSNPVLRYIVQRERRRFRLKVRLIGNLLGLAVIAALTYFSFYLDQDHQLIGISSRGESRLYTLAYIPLLILQFAFVSSGLSVALSLGLTSPLLPLEQQREAWEMVKITSHGAELTLRSRWAGVYYYLGLPLLLMGLLRAMFVAEMLIDLLAGPGRILGEATASVTPEVSQGAAAAGMGVFMLAALIQPFVLLGLLAASGLYLSSLIRSRVILRMLLGGLSIAQMLVFMMILPLAAIVLADDPALGLYLRISAGERWLIMLVFALLGDHSLYFLDLPAHIQLWKDLDYGVLIGPVIAAVVLIELLLIRVMIRAAARRGARPARE